jgi:hypothetical protein
MCQALHGKRHDGISTTSWLRKRGSLGGYLWSVVHCVTSPGRKVEQQRDPFQKRFREKAIAYHLQQHLSYFKLLLHRAEAGTLMCGALVNHCSKSNRSARRTKQNQLYDIFRSILHCRNIGIIG